MNKLDNNDKTKLDEILNEIINLKRYSNELASNTRGEKLENYINNLTKNINSLENKIEYLYENNFNKPE